ncbi:P2Y purinoceptor 8-like [Tachyglossus aculeatus]|uniref:P2Y purinoceptor 8-like n=1 Tax=Tachyglossus aculeatus TaxID=9261 RepID=UPI0018F35576|nr:P2Y purinoceptor 8-like [Tachyglossus aculeatus]
MSNSSLANTTLEMLQNRMLQITLPVFHLLIFAVSLPLNSLCLWILSCHSRPRVPTVIFAINLAVTDLLYSLMLPFQATYHLQGHNWPFGSALCRTLTVLFYGNMEGSIFTMTGISIERYLGIVHPLRSQHLRTNRMAVWTCLCIWGGVLLGNYPFMSNDLTFPVQELGIVTCFDILPRKMFPEPWHFTLFFGFHAFLTFPLPLLIMGFCYGSVIRTLLRSSSSISGETKRQAVSLIVVVLVVFVLCYLPNSIITVLHLVYLQRDKTAYVEYKLSLAVNSLNACIDPFLYYFGSREFRQKMRQIWGRIGSCGGKRAAPAYLEQRVIFNN